MSIAKLNSPPHGGRFYFGQKGTLSFWYDIFVKDDALFGELYYVSNIIKNQLKVYTMQQRPADSVNSATSSSLEIGDLIESTIAQTAPIIAQTTQQIAALTQGFMDDVEQKATQNLPALDLDRQALVSQLILAMRNIQELLNPADDVVSQYTSDVRSFGSIIESHFSSSASNPTSSVSEEPDDASFPSCTR